VPTNRLANERSPYLRQHMHNPVDWRPWGAEAFAEAKAKDKPVFLSIGYAACHWCHVMEHESFEDERVAAVLNDAFVCVKVDREERPDLDDVYMAATQITTGRGGWPMTCFLTPEGKPFFAGTYFPPAHVVAMAQRAKAAWRDRRDAVLAQAEEIAGLVREHAGGGSLPPVEGTDDEVLAAAVDRLASEFDDRRGGFDRVPKFPPHAALLFLLDVGGRNGGERGLSMARKTLDEMARGGVRDHVGGGFHRYSTDAEWLVPHFEKMLYDNALLATAYAEAHAIGGEARFAAVARETLRWVVREMSVEGGGYASSLDADTQGGEGLTYTWTPQEIRAGLPAPDAAFAERVFGVREGGNFHEEASGQAAGRNILHLPVPLDEVAKSEMRPLAALLADLERVKAALLVARARKPQPARDGKVILGWNGLLLTAFARAGARLHEDEWTRRATDLATFLLAECRDGGRWLRLPKASGPKIPAFLDDHAHLADGLLDLAEATGDARWATEAKKVADEILARFPDPAGGFHSTSGDHEALLARPKDAFDSPIPSGNATAARVLLRLAARTKEPAYRAAADRTIAAFLPLMARAPTGTTAMFRALADRRAAGPAPAPAADAPSSSSATGGGIPPPGVAGDAHVDRTPIHVDAFLERGEARPGTSVRVLLRVTVEEGWHVNAAGKAPENLVATRVESAPKAPATLVDVAYPEATPLSLAEGQPPLPALAGTFAIRGSLAIPPGAPMGPRKIGLLLTVQPCDVSACRAPEEIRVDVPLRFAAADSEPRHPDAFPR
jgi:uncharacterized protein YyaL (SSP411 family)